jgi:hypothetical protein
MGIKIRVRHDFPDDPEGNSTGYSNIHQNPGISPGTGASSLLLNFSSSKNLARTTLPPKNRPSRSINAFVVSSDLSNCTKILTASSRGKFGSVISNIRTLVTVPYFAHSDPTSSSSSSSTSPGPTFQKKREIFSKFSSSFMNPKNEAWDRHFILKPYSI